MIFKSMSPVQCEENEKEGTMTTNSYSDLHPNLLISPSRKVHHLLFTKMRNKFTTSKEFVQYSKRSMRILAEDALSEFPSTEAKISTPCGYVQS